MSSSLIQVMYHMHLQGRLGHGQVHTLQSSQPYYNNQ